jgi:hypothetical protein
MDGRWDGRRGRTDAFDGGVFGIEAADCGHFGWVRGLKNIVRGLSIVQSDYGGIVENRCGENEVGGGC